MINASLAALLLVPVLTFSTESLAYAQDDHDPHRESSQVRQVQGSSHYGLRDQVVYRNEGGQQSQHRPPRPKQSPADPRNPSVSMPGARPSVPLDSWHGDRRVWNGMVYWHADIRLFPRYDWTVWRSGYWYHGWYNGLWAWWWIAGGVWFYYPVPIYPYPNPYVPGTVTVINNQVPPETPPAQAPVAQYWYHCKAPEGYYPYVSECPGGWTKVPATPVASRPANAPPPATH